MPRRRGTLIINSRTENVPSDLWWIDLGDDVQGHFLYAGHHLPITDDDDPKAIQWFHSIQGGRLSQNKVRHPTSSLETWIDQCSNTNVYRSLQIFRSLDSNDSTLGPLLIDIENSDWDDNAGAYKENLEDALDVARRAARVLTGQWHIKTDDLRVFFTGRKGFNLEIRPSALGIGGSYSQQLKKSFEMQNQIRDELRAEGNFLGTTVGSQGTVIDNVYGSPLSGVALRHPYIRLHGSINRWISAGQEIFRRKAEVQLDDLLSQDIGVIVDKSAV